MPTPLEHLQSLLVIHRAKEGDRTALFRPSSGGRWLTCAGSTILSTRAPKETRSSEAAQEGTAAHKVSEDALRGLRQPIELLGRRVEGIFVDEEMVEKTQIYIDGAQRWLASGVDSLVEYRLSLAPLDPSDPFLAEVAGTADNVILDCAAGRIVVRDLKYGKGVRVKSSSPQLRLYGLMALIAFDPPPGGWVEVVCEVTQPRLPNEDDWVTAVSYTPQELLDFLGEVYTALHAAVVPDAPVTPGDHCRWCPGASLCPALAQRAQNAAIAAFAAAPLLPATAATPLPPAPTYVSGPPLPVTAALPGLPADTTVRCKICGEPEFGSPQGPTCRNGHNRNMVLLPDPESVSVADLAKWLEGEDLIDAWFKAVKHRAVQLLTLGAEVPGWKLVPRSTRRRFDDAEAVANALLTVGLTREQVFEIRPPALKSPKGIEDIPAKELPFSKGDLKEIVKSLVVYPPGEPTLVRAADVRDAVAPVFPPLPSVKSIS